MPAKKTKQIIKETLSADKKTKDNGLLDENQLLDD
jgi:hypothetical protein